MTTSPDHRAKSSDRFSPIFFLVILALIVGFIAAFLILRPAGGGTKQTPTTTQPSEPPMRN